MKYSEVIINLIPPASYLIYQFFESSSFLSASFSHSFNSTVFSVGSPDAVMELLERVWTPAKVRGREGKREGVWTSLILSLPNSGKIARLLYLIITNIIFCNLLMIFLHSDEQDEG